MRESIENMNEQAGIYCIRNIVNGIIYIGSSKDVFNRKIHHFSDLRCKRHNNARLQNSFNKYGESNFEFYVIELVEESKLIPREQYWIDYYNSAIRNKGFNIQSIAGRTTPWMNIKHHSEESIEKIRKSNLGQKRTPETIEKIRQSHIGYKMPQSQKDRIGLKSKGNKHRLGLPSPMKGKKLKKESILKRTETRKKNGGYIVSEETRKKKSLSMMGKNKGRKSWCSGLTKETDERLAKLSMKNKESITQWWKKRKQS